MKPDENAGKLVKKDIQEVIFEDLFDLKEIQRLQDLFAKATGVACQILRPDGTFITGRSNYCRLCGEIIRGNKEGQARCTESDLSLGELSHSGLNIYRCRSAGLLEAGAPICVGGRHIATWGLGQVCDGSQTEAGIREFAREIGVDEGAAVEAFNEVTVMSRERFEDVAKTMHAIANQLATIGYQNLQRKRLIEEQEQTKEELFQFEWLLEKEGTVYEERRDEYQPPYSDVTELNTQRVILDAVGNELLKSMARDIMDLLDTSVAVYEANGDYAYGVFTSSWCRLFDAASFRLCGTSDTKEALNSGKWQCHECCWNESALAAMESGKPADIECVGGIRLFAMPILVDGEVIGAINIGYGTPPRDDATLQELARKFDLDIQDIRRAAEDYRPRPQYIIDVAKRRCQSIANHISEIVQHKRTQSALEDRERQLKTLMDNLPGIAYRCPNDFGWPMIFMSAGCHKITGYSPEELGGTEPPVYGDLVHPADCQEVQSVVDESILNGKPFIVEYRIRDKQGQEHWVWEQGRSVGKDENGVDILEGFISDITGRKVAEAALARQQERFKLASDAAEFGIWDLDLIKNELIWDERMFRLYGLDPEGFGGAYEYWQKGVHPDDIDRASREVEQAVSGEKPFDTEFRVVHPDGSIRHLKAYATVSRDDQGRGIRMTGVNYDITELRQSESKFRSYVEQSPFGVFITDGKGNYVDTNPAASRITGYTREELLQMKILDLVPPDGREAGAAHFKKLVETGFADGVLQYLRKDGVRRLWNVTATNLGKDRFLGYVQDVTEREQMEKQVRAAQRLDAVGHLAGGVAHDFNNLLMGIMGYTELCLDEIEDGHPTREYLGEIMNEAHRSADIVRQLLAFSRKQTIAPRQLSLNDAVENILKMLRRLIGEDIDLLWQPASRLKMIKIDPGQVDQIMANLCVNARDAIRGVGKITIETENAILDDNYCATHSEVQPGNFVMLAVSDNGVGMDAETLENVFEPFFTTKGPGEGTGLGLATVYGIVKQNSGSISVYSEPGEGTVFRLYFPCCEDQSGEEAGKKASAPVPRGTETLLIVEDQPAICRTIRLFLKPLGYTVYTAESPVKALEFMEKHGDKIDVLITDVVMPEMNGRELAEKLLEMKPDLKVLYISGYTSNVVVHRGILEEGVNFLSKPITRGQLARALRDILE